jgi:hypothetical protein
MKKMIVLGLAVASLNSLSAWAAADSKYPAADFEPSVIYSAKEVVAGDPAQHEVDPKYPAANFTPIVIFIDNKLADQAQSQDEFDPKYPAAYFKPKVIYP